MIDVSKITAFTTLELGRVGENEFRPQQINVSAWLKVWPDATVSAVFSRPDGQLYTVVTDVTTSPLTWTPGTADLAVAGDGKLELRIITADGVVGKSAIISTVTHGSLGATGDPPTPPAPDWTATVAENAAEARSAATDAQQAAQAASDAQQAINTAEPARVEAEQERATAESERASAESDRATAESNRSTAESGRQTAENNRATSEQNRATAETNRANAESTRVTAESDRNSAEITRGQNESTRQSNESTRQSNESARVSAENTRAAFYNGFNASISELNASVSNLGNDKLDKTSVVNDLTTGGATKALSAEQGKVLSASISELTADVDFPVTNLVTNGDFSKRTTGWTSAYGTITVSDGICTYTVVTPHSSSRIDFAAKIPNFISGNIYYASFYAYSSTATSGRIYLGDGWVPSNPSSSVIIPENLWTRISSAKTVISNNELAFYINTSTMSVGQQVQFKLILAVDIASDFGTGNEPTVAEMDAMLAAYPNSWFDGTVNFASNPRMLPYLLNQIRQLNTEKTGYGVYSGLGVTAQSTPYMTVSVAAGVIYMDTGRRFAPAANTALAINSADAKNPRIDIVYVNSSGVISYLAGTAAASPSAPSVPTGCQKLAEITVAANATTITSAAIADRRKNLWSEAWITPTLLNGATGTFKYRKNNLNRLECKGTLVMSNVASTALFLATGYRPLASVHVPVAHSAGASNSSILSSGGIYLAANNVTYYFDNVSIPLD